MLKFPSKYACCGCEACAQICPKHCITLSEDAEGFMYPSVDEQSCIDCGLCEKVCPFKNSQDPVTPLEVYAAKNRSEKDLLHSSSGGVFVMLARKILDMGGVVFGVAFTPDYLSVQHVPVEKESELPILMGSKYIQSRTGTSFQQVKTFLEGGRQVLFCGTGCQVLALKLFLRKEYENLITVDFICHGVPSPKVWRQYLQEITSEGDAITNISFRDKRTGWSNFSFTIDYVKGHTHEEKRITQPNDDDPYMWLFLNDYTLRPSCFGCPAKGGKSRSDLTLGDYWGIEKAHPECFDERGVSSLIVNSTKGKEILEGLELDKQNSTLALATEENPTYYVPKEEPKELRLLFFQKWGSGEYTIEKLAKLFRKKKDRKDFFLWIKRKLRAIKKRIL